MSRIPQDTTKIFTDIWDNNEDFLDDWKECGLYKSGLISDDSVSTIFFLLYAKHGNSAIANWDVTQFKYKVFALIYQYGPTWEKRLDIQTKIRALTDADLVKGSKSINAHAYAMGDDTVLADDDPTKIDQKSSTIFEKSKLEGYATLLDLLETDVTNEFINRFKPLFATFIRTRPTLFVTDLEEEEDE